MQKRKIGGDGGETTDGGSEVRGQIRQRDKAGKQACPPVVENPEKQEQAEGLGGRVNIRYPTEQYSISKHGEGRARSEVHPTTNDHGQPARDGDACYGGVNGRGVGARFCDRPALA